MPGIHRNKATRAAHREAIARLRLQSCTVPAIAAEIGVSPATVKRELQHLELEWRTEAAASVEQQKALALARLEHLYAEAWTAWEANRDPRYLQLALAAIDRTARLLGLEAPQKIAHTNPYGSALSKEHRDAVVAAAFYAVSLPAAEVDPQA